MKGIFILLFVLKGKLLDTLSFVVPSRSEIHCFYPQGLLWLITTTRNPWAVWHKAWGAHCLERFAFSRIFNLPQILSLQGWSSSQSLFTESLTSRHSFPPVRLCTLFCKTPSCWSKNKFPWHWTAARLGSPSIALDQTQQ